MPIFYDKLVDQVEDLLPDFYREDGPRFVSFLKAYFEFLEKGQLVYKDAVEFDYIGLEDGTVAGEVYNADGQRGNLILEPQTYTPSSLTNVKIIYDRFDPEISQVTQFEVGEYIVGSQSGAIARVDVIGPSSNLYIEHFSESQFDVSKNTSPIISTKSLQPEVDAIDSNNLNK